MIKEFTLLKKYEEQFQEKEKVQQKYADAVSEAEQVKSEAETSLSNLIRKEMVTGKNTIKAKEDARIAVKNAEQILINALEEQRLASTYLNNSSEQITSMEVVQAYIYEYRPSIRKQILPSIQQQILQGKALIADALYKYQEIKPVYYDVGETIEEMSKQDHIAGKTSVLYAINPIFRNYDEDTDLNLIHFQNDLNDILNGDAVPEIYIEAIEENKLNNEKGDK